MVVRRVGYGALTHIGASAGDPRLCRQVCRPADSVPSSLCSAMVGQVGFHFGRVVAQLAILMAIAVSVRNTANATVAATMASAA